MSPSKGPKRPSKRRKTDTDHCVGCGSENLFSGFFDADGLGVPDDTGPGWRWTTYCNQCGDEQP
jgi:hypothetical protein